MAQPLLGRQIRFIRKQNGMTLSEVAALVGRPQSYLSQLENGKIDPRTSTVGDIAEALGCSIDQLNSAVAPTRRDELEIAIESAQQKGDFADLKLPYFRPTSKTSDTALEQIAGLYEALAERTTSSAPRQPDIYRSANRQLRDEMRERNNYFAEIEAESERVLKAVNYDGSGPVSEGKLADIASHYGFKISRVRDLPRSTRSVTDQRNRVIYIPQRDVLTSRGTRSVVLQTLGHFVLGHRDTDNFADYLRQRVESNYFAGAILAPLAPTLRFLRDAYDNQNLSVADLREVFFLSYEMAAHRLTNLATEHFDLTLHFIRSDEEGTVWKFYENDEVPLPTAVDGTVVGESLCRLWGSRQAFEAEDGYDLHYQWTQVEGRDYWGATFVESDRNPMHSITIGTDAKQAKFFRGSDTTYRTESRCPNPTCCREPSSNQRDRWRGVAWPSARDRSHVLSGMPPERPEFSKFPGVDMIDVYGFLDGKL